MYTKAHKEFQKNYVYNIELMPGMIVSNEPGYYKVNEYGIRIENLIIVQEDKNNLFLKILPGAL